MSVSVSLWWKGWGKKKMDWGEVSKLQGLYNKESWEKKGGEEEEEEGGSSTFSWVVNCCKTEQGEEEKMEDKVLKRSNNGCLQVY